MRKVLAMLLLAACGDDGPAMKLEDFLVQRREAACSRLTRCGLFTGEDICTNFFRTPDEDSLIAAVTGKKITYDGGAAVKCVEALAVIGCDRTQKDARLQPKACDDVFVGKVADGADCAFADECRSGVCNNIPTCLRDTCCYGTCGASTISPIDGPCNTDFQCDTTAYCHKTKVCKARVAENRPCDDARGCDFGTVCVGVTEFDPGTCRKLPLIGESCPYNLCAELGARCSNFTCVAYGLAGAACAMDAECSPYADCDEPAGKCVETPTLGQTCTTYCAGDAWCSGDTCIAGEPEKTMCTSDIQCESTYCAEGVVFDQCEIPAVCI